MLFDAHVLLGRDRWLAENRPDLAHTLDLPGLRMTMDAAAAGEDWRAAVCPFPSADSPDYIRENEAVLAAAAEDPRLLPVAVSNPNDAANLRWLHEAAEAGSIAGLMIWPILSNLDLRALSTNNTFWDFVAAYDLPVTIHVATGDEPSFRPAVAANAYGPLDALANAEARPDIRFNLLHALRLSRPALERAAALRNVYTDLSGYSSFGRWMGDGKETFPAADPVLGPDEPVRLLDMLAARYQFAGRLMFGSSEPFCRWWGFTARLENETLLRGPDAMGGIERSSSLVAAADTFYRNWTGHTQRGASPI